MGFVEEVETPRRTWTVKNLERITFFVIRLMGKVASDKCHKWVFKEPSECEARVSNYWQSSFDALPPEWNGQFDCGIQTIAVIQAGHGLLQLGSCKIIPEDLHFVLRMRHTFESLGFQSGLYVTQIFSLNRNLSNSSLALPCKQSAISRPPMPTKFLNWTQRSPPMSAASPQSFQTIGYSQAKVEPSQQRFLLSHLEEARMGEDMDGNGEPDSDIKWPNGLSFFNALTGRAEDSKIHSESLGNKAIDHRNVQNGMRRANPCLTLDNHPEGSGTKSFNIAMKMSGGRMATSSSSSELQRVEFKNREAGGLYSDAMDFL